MPEDSARGKVSVVNIPLEGFSHEKGQDMFQTLTSLLTDARVRVRDPRQSGWLYSEASGEPTFKTILRVLWQDVVKPVIEGLAFQVCLLILPLFSADAFSPDRTKPTSPYLVVCDRITRVPPDSRCWAV
jgi:hypothetical protein